MTRFILLCYNACREQLSSEDGGGTIAIRIEFSKTAVKTLQHMDKALRNRIREAIKGLTQTPPQGDIKPMEGKPSGRYRLRVGGYRVIYCYDHDGVMVVLYILDVGPCGDIYK